MRLTSLLHLRINSSYFLRDKVVATQPAGGSLMSDFASEYATDLEDRFVRYVRIDTQSDSRSPGVPSTRKQFDLLNLLKQELEELGASNVRTTESGFTIATVPATVRFDTPRLA